MYKCSVGKNMTDNLLQDFPSQIKSNNSYKVISLKNDINIVKRYILQRWKWRRSEEQFNKGSLG